MLKIGHRGAAGIAPENTLAAVKKAIELGMDMVELDVQLSKDEKLVVIHDRKLARVANCKQKVKELTVKELKKLDVGSWFHKQSKGEKIPTLEEAIDLAAGKLKLNIELKPGLENKTAAINQLISLLQDKNFSNQVIISSFNHSVVKEVKNINSNLKTAVLMAACPLKPVKVIDWANSDGLHLEQQLVTKEVVIKVKQANYFINTWTVNDRERVNQLQNLKIDGIITDYPELIV